MNATADIKSELVIEMTGVTGGTIRDPAAEIVRDVNWRVTAGDFWVVSGLQGVGKGDLLMLTAGLLPPSHGTLRLFGEELPDFDEGRMEQRLKLGFVFDDGRLFHTLTVAENIALPMQYHCDFTDDEILERTIRLLEFAELMPYANVMAGAPGRNWQKRAGLARALALQPELLLVDNPVSGADPRHAEWWVKVLAELSLGHDWMPEKRPTTVVVTADDARSWHGVAKQFAVLSDGRLEIIGPKN